MTGVQTCALPICSRGRQDSKTRRSEEQRNDGSRRHAGGCYECGKGWRWERGVSREQGSGARARGGGEREGAKEKESARGHRDYAEQSRKEERQAARGAAYRAVEAAWRSLCCLLSRCSSPLRRKPTIFHARNQLVGLVTCLCSFLPGYSPAAECPLLCSLPQPTPLGRSLAFFLLFEEEVVNLRLAQGGAETSQDICVR